MGLWFGRKFAGLPTEREEEMWKLITSLQQEKEALRVESRMWQERFLTLAGIGNQTYTPAPEPESTASKGPEVLGRHVSLMGLRHKYEQRSREEAAKYKSEDKRDAS